MNEFDTIALDSIAHVAEVIEKALNDFIQSFAKVIENISKQIREAMKAIAPAFSFSLRLAAAVQRYPNKRIAWLALHHPKAKIRKKNLRRIIRWGYKEGYYL